MRSPYKREWWETEETEKYDKRAHLNNPWIAQNSVQSCFCNLPHDGIFFFSFVAFSHKSERDIVCLLQSLSHWSFLFFHFLLESFNLFLIFILSVFVYLFIFRSGEKQIWVKVIKMIEINVGWMGKSRNNARILIFFPFFSFLYFVFNDLLYEAGTGNLSNKKATLNSYKNHILHVRHDLFHIKKGRAGKSNKNYFLWKLLLNSYKIVHNSHKTSTNSSFICHFTNHYRNSLWILLKIGLCRVGRMTWVNESANEKRQILLLFYYSLKFSTCSSWYSADIKDVGISKGKSTQKFMKENSSSHNEKKDL